MTITTENPTAAELLAGLYQAVACGDLDAARRHLHPDVVLHVPGRQPLSGDHSGVDAVLAFVAASSTTAGRTEKIEVLDVLDGAEHAAAYCHVTGERDGRSMLENRTLHLFRVAGGQIAEIWFHNWDQEAVDAFWS